MNDKTEVGKCRICLENRNNLDSNLIENLEVVRGRELSSVGKETERVH